MLQKGICVRLIKWLDWILVEYLKICCLREYVPNALLVHLTVGAPEYTYGRGLFKSLKKAGVNLNNWHELAHDKTKWIKMIYDV